MQQAVMKAWREWMIENGATASQAEWFIAKGYDYCKFLYEAHRNNTK